VNYQFFRNPELQSVINTKVNQDNESTAFKEFKELRERVWVIGFDILFELIDVHDSSILTDF
jgi:hypothetical protein